MPPESIKLPEKGHDLAVRYVLLHHTGVLPEHYDLMILLPGEQKLVTWRILPPPETWPLTPPAAERIADHRLAYLEFEGDISGGRGNVTRIDHGNASLTPTSDRTCRLDLQGKLSCSLLLDF